MNKFTNITDKDYLLSEALLNVSIISFTGIIDSNTETYLITQVEAYLDSVKYREATKTKIMEIVIELLQNILHHTTQQSLNDNITGSTFKLEKSKKGFIISTSNFIPVRSIPALTKRIEYLNTLTPDELTSLYKDILKNGNDARETAGLGFIDIRRKSGKPLLFMFAPAGNNYSLFTVKALV
jgi:hypothetical protein